MADYESLQNVTTSQWPSRLQSCLSFVCRWTGVCISASMPSIRSLSHSLFSTISLVTQTVLGLQSPVRRLDGSELAASASCPHPQLSCHNSTMVKNLCCFNAPGGSLLQTQFWDTDPATGPSDSWTIHGLWVSTPCTTKATKGWIEC